MDDVLDGESDRRVEPPGRLSLGSLAPGTYVIELQGIHDNPMRTPGCIAFLIRRGPLDVIDD
jgi:hypothetical protein